MLVTALDICKSGKWNCSDPVPNEAVEGHMIYPRDSSKPRNPVPKFETPKLSVPFVPSVGGTKANKKEINDWTTWNLELSVREGDGDVIAFGEAVDAFTLNAVLKHGDVCYGEGTDVFELKVKQRRCMPPKKEFKRAPKPPFLWRFKIHPKTTKFYKVVGIDTNMTEQVKLAKMADIKQWSNVRIIGKFSSIYVSAASFGPNFHAESVLIYEPDSYGKDDEEDNDDFFAGGNFVVLTDEDGLTGSTDAGNLPDTADLEYTLSPRTTEPTDTPQAPTVTATATATSNTASITPTTGDTGESTMGDAANTEAPRSSTSTSSGKPAKRNTTARSSSSKDDQKRTRIEADAHA